MCVSVVYAVCSLRLRDFDNGVCHTMKITVAEVYPDLGLLTQQTVFFTPIFWLEPIEASNGNVGKF